jgi:L-threonylcarbamoyladenylate synthase
MVRRWPTALRPLEPLLDEVADVLRAGGVVAYPTDTLYGLAADPWQSDAVARLFAIKAREPGHAIPLIADSLEQVEAQLGRLSPLAARLAQTFWPGPLSIVVPAPASLPAAITGGRDGVAIRVPAHRVAAGLARALGRPITATSANLSGSPASADADRVAVEIGTRIDGIVDDGPAPGGAASTIVDVREGTLRLVRSGAVPWDRVVQFLA